VNGLEAAGARACDVGRGVVEEQNAVCTSVAVMWPPTLMAYSLSRLADSRVSP
jgi:hypothetical protein